jgi:hypothetical protein
MDDPDFRRELLAQPKTVLAALGVVLPANIEVRVVEEQPETLYIVLPYQVPHYTEELPEAELDTVVGGSTGCYLFYATEVCSV